jgi:hypothetical protein
VFAALAATLPASSARAKPVVTKADFIRVLLVFPAAFITFLLPALFLGKLLTKSHLAELGATGQ